MMRLPRWCREVIVAACEPEEERGSARPAEVELAQNVPNTEPSSLLALMRSAEIAGQDPACS
jgi:hypothetical protein